MKPENNPLRFAFWVSRRRRLAGTIVSLNVMALLYIAAMAFGYASFVERRADRALEALQHSRGKFSLFERFAPNMDFYWSFALGRAQGSEASFGDLRVRLLRYDDANPTAPALLRIEGVTGDLGAPNLEGIELSFPLARGGLKAVCSRERDLVLAFEEFTFQDVRLGLAARNPMLLPERFEEAPFVVGGDCR
jgi:hypothetical protein